MTFFHTLYGQSLKTKTLVQISVKNMHICTPHRLTHNGCLLLKSKEHLLLKTIGFIGYNFHYVRQLQVQIHVSQSSTYPEIYVDLEALSTLPKPFWEHMHYVAFSRVTSIAGLYIESINEKIYQFPRKYQII